MFALRSSSRFASSLLRANPATSALVGRRLLSDQARTQIQKAVEGSPVVMFMKGTPQMPECGFSRAATQVLEISGVPLSKLKTYNVLQDDELRQGIKEFSYVGYMRTLLTLCRKSHLHDVCREWPTIPQVYVNGEFVGGCDILLSSALPTFMSFIRRADQTFSVPIWGAGNTSRRQRHCSQNRRERS